MEVLYDPGAFTEFDWDNSTDENRWRTIGLDKDGYPIFVVHTYDDTLPEEHLVRIISARRLTKREAQNYWKERSP